MECAILEDSMLGNWSLFIDLWGLILGRKGNPQTI
jgi:hypothetical protein